MSLLVLTRVLSAVFTSLFYVRMNLVQEQEARRRQREGAKEQQSEVHLGGIWSILYQDGSRESSSEAAELIVILHRKGARNFDIVSPRRGWTPARGKLTMDRTGLHAYLGQKNQMKTKMYARLFDGGSILVWANGQRWVLERRRLPGHFSSHHVPKDEGTEPGVKKQEEEEEEEEEESM